MAENKSENKIVETYAEDMARVLQDDKEGLVKKVIHGEEEHEQEKKDFSPQSSKNKLFMFIGILLIFLAFVMLSFFFFREKNNTVPVDRQFAPLIFNDQTTFVEIAEFNKDEIAQTVLNQVNATEVKSEGVEGIYLTENKKIVGLRRFLSLTKSNLIVGGDTSFVNEIFLLGVINVGTDSSQKYRPGFFVLLKVRSTGDIFDSLRAWEGKMFLDMYKFFGINLSKDTNYLSAKNFEDGIVENKNARILYDTNGKIVLMYIFADDNSVIITDSEKAAQEIILRLAASRAKQ